MSQIFSFLVATSEQLSKSNEPKSERKRQTYLNETKDRTVNTHEKHSIKINTKTEVDQSNFQIVKMVCEKCEKKLGKVITPDPWKSGARNTTESGGRKVNENKALTSSRSRFNPVDQTFKPCRYVIFTSPNLWDSI